MALDHHRAGDVVTRATEQNRGDGELGRGVLGIITARGGSKGVPGKNIAEVGGKPLLAWTVEKATLSSAIERLIISTDDPIIADVARRAGAEVPFLRPQSLAADDTTHRPVIQHALAQQEAQGHRPSHIVVLQPTSPLVSADDIAACVHLAKTRGAAAVISVTRFHGHPSWLIRIELDGRLTRWEERAAMAERRQNGAAAFIPNGAVYVLSRDLVRNGDDWYGTSTLAYEMPRERALDIDDAWDLRLTRLLFADRV